MLESRSNALKTGFPPFFKIDSPSEVLDGKDRALTLKILEIVSKIESQAYYEGCHLAVGFGGTACKATLCPNSKYAVLKREESCRFAGRSCPSMHGAVMDLFRMAVRAGQYIYPGGTATKTMDVPFVSYLGLILIDW